MNVKDTDFFVWIPAAMMLQKTPVAINQAPGITL
jgi:hypothetical protein